MPLFVYKRELLVEISSGFQMERDLKKVGAKSVVESVGQHVEVVIKDRQTFDVSKLVVEVQVYFLGESWTVQIQFYPESIEVGGYNTVHLVWTEGWKVWLDFHGVPELK